MFLWVREARCGFEEKGLCYLDGWDGSGVSWGDFRSNKQLTFAMIPCQFHTHKEFRRFQMELGGLSMD